MGIPSRISRVTVQKESREMKQAPARTPTRCPFNGSVYTFQKSRVVYYWIRRFGPVRRQKNVKLTGNSYCTRQEVQSYFLLLKSTKQVIALVKKWIARREYTKIFSACKITQDVKVAKFLKANKKTIVVGIYKLLTDPRAAKAKRMQVARQIWQTSIDRQLDKIIKKSSSSLRRRRGGGRRFHCRDRFDNSSMCR